MNVWLIEPYYVGSHRAWADGYQAHSRHTVHILKLPGRFWKWRMEGGAVTLARRAQARGDRPDLILASDMLNLPVFMGLVGQKLADVPVVLYFHENQLTYPLRPDAKRDLHYGFINFVSALRADILCFNSTYHQKAFFKALPRMLKHFPDHNELWAVQALQTRSRVLPLGLDMDRFDRHRPDQATALSRRPWIVWNHRWEYDKDPATFFRALYALADEADATASGLDFGLVLLGRSFRNQPDEFLTARERLAEQIVHIGYAQDLATYSQWLWQADIVVSTARHDFFGVAVVEACYCGCYPVLPHALAYPELIPTVHHPACLYQNFDGLLEKLCRALTYIDETRAFSLQHHVARYNWRLMAPHYDTFLENLAQKRDRPGTFDAIRTS